MKWMRSCRLLRSSLRCKCVGWGQEGVQDRGTDVCCIVTVCVDGRGPGAAFVSPAFKSTRSTFSCLVPPLPSTQPPPPSSPLLTAREMCIYVCVYVVWGCLGLKEKAPAVPYAPPRPPPSQVTVGGPSWLALGRLDPYGTGGGEKKPG